MKTFCLERPVFKMPTSPQAKIFKKLEAARVARLKKAGQGIVHTLKKADQEAREMWIQELRDMAQASEDILKEAESKGKESAE